MFSALVCVVTKPGHGPDARQWREGEYTKTRLHNGILSSCPSRLTTVACSAVDEF